MGDPIRVLHVIGIMNRGGAETMIMNLYRNIDRNLVQFDFVEHCEGPAAFDEEISNLGGRIYHCPHYNGKNHFIYSSWWNSFFHEHKYPIVHGHIGSTAAIYLSIAKKYGAYAIAHSHSAGAGSVMYRVFSYPTRYIADYFLACSKDAALSRYGKKVSNNGHLCKVLHNAVDAKQFAFDQAVRQQVRNELHIQTDATVIGHVGRFVDAKNHLFLIDIFERIANKCPRAVLLLIGDGILRPQIERHILENGLEERVILAGIQRDVWKFYQAMDLFLMPSRYEGLPVSLVEAQASGLPCYVSTAVPQESAITDLVRFRSLSDSAEQWAGWILGTLPRERRNMVSHIQAAGYDITATAQWLQDFYMKVANSRD